MDIGVRIKDMKKWGIEMVLFVIGFILCVTALYYYNNREESFAVKASKNLDELIFSIRDIKAAQISQDSKINAIIQASDLKFTDLSKRVSELENKKPLTNLNDINLRFTTPLQISVVYRQSEKKKIPPQINGKTSLLSRAQEMSK